MRILLVTPYHAPAYHFGGPIVVAEVAVAELVARGHRVTVATTDALDADRRVPADAPAVPAGAEVVRFRNVNHALAARAMAWTPRGFRAWIRRHVAEYDAVLLHDVYSVLSVSAARAAAAAGVPFVLQPMGSLAPTRERGRPLVKRAFLALWGRRTLADATALAYSSEQERRDFLAAGAPAERLAPLPLPLRLPPPAGLPEAAVPTVVSVGRLDPIKNLDVLIHAVAIARRQESRLRLEIAGPGDLGAELQEQARRLGIEDAVRLHGFVSTEEKARLLETAHAFALLSRSEGLPVAALEAMACGTPVIVSTGCHLPEVDDRAGIEVEADPQAAADAILALLADGTRRKRLGDGARAFAEPFRSDRAVDALEALLAQVAEQGARQGTR